MVRSNATEYLLLYALVRTAVFVRHFRGVLCWGAPRRREPNRPAAPPTNNTKHNEANETIKDKQKTVQYNDRHTEEAPHGSTWRTPSTYGDPNASCR